MINIISAIIIALLGEYLFTIYTAYKKKHYWFIGFLIIAWILLSTLGYSTNMLISILFFFIAAIIPLIYFMILQANKKNHKIMKHRG